MSNDETFKRLAISETGFVFDPQTGYSYLVNNIGVEILNCLKKEMKQREILEHITRNYDVEEDQIERDFESFVLRLKEYGLYKEEMECSSPLEGKGEEEKEAEGKQKGKRKKKKWLG